MKKRVKGRILSREKDQRRALLRSLARQLLLKEKIKTTESKAKEVASFVEKKITKSKLQNLSARRELLKDFSPEIVKKMMTEIAERFKERKGGYTRIIKIGPRKSDGAKMALIEIISKEDKLF